MCLFVIIVMITGKDQAYFRSDQGSELSIVDFIEAKFASFADEPDS